MESILSPNLDEVKDYPVIDLGDGWYLHMVPDNHPLSMEAHEVDMERLRRFQQALRFGYSALQSVKRNSDNEVPYEGLTADAWNFMAWMAGTRWFYENLRRLVSAGEAMEAVDRSVFYALHTRLLNPFSEVLTVNRDAVQQLAEKHQIKMHLEDEDVIREIQFWEQLGDRLGGGQVYDDVPSWYTTQSVAEQVMPQEEGEGGTGGNLRMLGLPDAEAVPHFAEYGGATYRHKPDKP